MDNDARVTKRTGEAAKRLDAQAWVVAALKELADGGIDSVSVQRLARKLEVTKGSFYWHFRDRDALLDAMLDTWRRKATILVMSRLEQHTATSRERLAGLLAFPFVSPLSTHGADVELAIRLWSRRDARARKVLDEIDHLRLRFIITIFTEMGFTPEAAKARATLTYGFMRIGASLPHDLGLQTLPGNLEKVLMARESDFAS